MKFSYKCDFLLTKKRMEYIYKIVRKGDFYIKNGIVISKEFPKRELGRLSYDAERRKGRARDKPRKQYKYVLKLCRKYNHNFNNVLEVGAGFGYFAEMFIMEFKPQKYTLYEFSSETISTIERRMEKFPTETVIRNETFKNITDVHQYDCIIAQQVLEHINWDKDFLKKIKPKTWVFLSLPTVQGYCHVRAFLTPDSIAYRYRKILKIYEIRHIPRSRIYKYPHQWAIVARKI